MKKFFNSDALIGEVYSKELHERWKCYRRCSPRHERHYLEMPDGSVTEHSWNVSNNHFTILNFYHGIGEYRWDGVQWHIDRCDHGWFESIIADARVKHYPGYRFSNLFSLNRDSKVPKDKRESIHARWARTVEKVSQMIIPYAEWDDFSHENHDKEFPITFVEHNDHHSLALERFYGLAFFQWFSQVGNAKYWYIVPKVLETVPYGHFIKIPSHFLQYPLKDWLDARDVYQAMPIEEYRVLFGDELPLTPYINEIPSYNEVVLIQG